MNKLKKFFNKEKHIIIGVIHFPPLLGYPKFPGFKVALKNAFKDLRALEEGGVDGIFIENNYDIPHKPLVDAEIIASMAYLGKEIRDKTKLPVGISVLWNDYRAALAIAKILDLQFIRIPVFVDKVKTSCGIITGEAKEVLEYRKKIKAENILLFTDIHVKHSELLSKNTLEQSARLAVENNADTLIVTGSWTGDAPSESDMARVREAINDFPLLVGSGADKNNIHNIFQYANGVIVNTSLKRGSIKKGEVNVKGYEQRIDVKKVREFIDQIK